MEFTKQKVHDVIFGTTTKAGRTFDLFLLGAIIVSICTVMLESIPSVKAKYYPILYLLEWIFTILFTAEYILRIWSSPHRKKYITSYWGIIDLVAILPSYLILIPWVSIYGSLRVLRAMRLLRVFRILKLNKFTSQIQVLIHAMLMALPKITIFISFVMILVIVLGTLIYIVEGGNNGFESIPKSIYWAIVTITTVGYGDIAPTTSLGRMISSFIMLMGYAIIAVPTGIMTVSMSRYQDPDPEDNKCEHCEHDNPFGSIYCNQCGQELTE